MLVTAQAVQAAAAAAAAAAHTTADADRQVLQAVNSNLKDELHSRAAAIEALVAARDEAVTSLAQAKQQVDAEQAAAAAAKAAAAALERQLGDLSAQVRPGRHMPESHALQFALESLSEGQIFWCRTPKHFMCAVLHTPSGPAAGIQRGSGAGSSRSCTAAAS
jgi:acyl-homoserine lactone acylase PvdQ